MPCASLGHAGFSSASCSDAEASKYHMEWIGPQHHERTGLQNFVADAFLKMYGAEVRHFCNVMVGCRDEQGKWIAALGFSLASDGETFLEQYLDMPLESAIASHAGTSVNRRQIVEVGNLAAVHVGAARELIACMTHYLHQQGLIWVAFTATRSLLNSFTRLRLEPRVLAAADPGRLSDAGKSWGTYYANNPQVMFGDIRSGYAQLVK